MTNGLDKRRFNRLEFPLDVVAEVVAFDDTPRGLPALRSESRNISKAGICLETTSLEIGGVNLLSGAPCARENRLLMTINLLPEEPSFTAIGEVRWYDVARGKSARLYQIGVEFLDIRGKGKDQLHRFLKNHVHEGLFKKFFG